MLCRIKMIKQERTLWQNQLNKKHKFNFDKKFQVISQKVNSRLSLI